MTCKRLDVLYSSGGFADVALGPKVENKINNNNKYYLIGLRKKNNILLTNNNAKSI